MTHRYLGGVLAAVLALAPAASYAQAPAVIRGIIRVAKVARGSAARLEDLNVGDQIHAGDRVRTAGRSAVGIRFPDQSVLRLGELSEVTITNPARRTVDIRAGSLFANFRAPGTITGGYAVAAVRGTHVQYTVNEEKKTAEVHCFEGKVYVGSGDNPLAAGVTNNVTPTTLTDQVLTDQTQDYTGGEIRFTDGPFEGQKRRITAFNRTTGQVTFAPALSGPKGDATQPTGYLLVKNPQRSIVELRNNEGTVIGMSLVPSAPRKVPSEKFAGLKKQPFFRSIEEGTNQIPYNGSDDHQLVQDDNAGLREATEVVVRPPGSGGNCFQSLIRPRFGLRTVLANQVADAMGEPRGGTPEQRANPAITGVPFGTELTEKVAFVLEPFGIATNQADAFGVRARVKATQGDVYGEIGYRYAWVDSVSNHDLSEFFVVVRSKQYGDVTVGRQHLFLRLANNTNLGTLLGLETTDAVMWQPNLGKYKQSIGYIFDTGPLASRDIAGTVGGGSFKTVFARGQMRVKKGVVGWSAMAPTDDHRQVGWSLDGSLPVLPNVLDIYGEGGVDTKDNELYVAGFYVPWLYYKTKVDLFLEYHNRKTVDERYTLRVRREFLKNLLLIGFLDRARGGTFNGGGGLLWSVTFK